MQKKPNDTSLENAPNKPGRDAYNNLSLKLSNDLLGLLSANIM